ncbi:MAG: ATP-binding protein [Dehalococcoidia bacterium]|nr:ATP-binding protein [Dehalococcoidia bacterium]
MSFLTNLNLWKKITLLTTIGLLFGVGVFSSLGLRAVSQASETMLEDRLTTAALVADYVDEALGRALSELDSAAQQIENGGDRSSYEPSMEALAAIYPRLSIHVNGIYVTNHRGEIVWSKSAASQAETGSLASFASIRQTINTGKTSVSGLVSLPGSDSPAILLSSPTREDNQGSRGALAVAVDLSRSGIGGFVKPIRLGQTGYVEIVDQNGIVVARTEPGPKLAPFEKSDHSGRFAALIAAREPTRGVCHTCHEPDQTVARRDVLAFVPLERANWGVVIRQSEDEALASTNDLRQRLLLFGVGLVTIALMLVVITTRDVGSRIRLLTTASQRIAEGDLKTPAPISGNDEVGALGRSFNDMRVKLKTSHDELQQKTRELSSLLLVSDILTSAIDLPSLLDAVVAKAVEIIPGADAGALLLHDPDRHGLAVRCAFGLDREALSQFSYAPGGSPADTLAAATGAFLQTEPLRGRTRSFISAPLTQHSRNIGSLIMVSFRDSQAFSESSRRLLQAIADYIAIAVERTQLTKEAEEARALYEADRLRSEFISSVSHELRTPLTLIKGYSTSLLRQDVSWDEGTQREFLQVIDEKTDLLRDLIDKLLQSAKLEAGALKLEKEPLLLPRLARKVVDDAGMRAKKHHLALAFANSFPVVEADVRCMEQVLQNLVQNAIKYSPEGSEIVIAGKVEDGCVVVSVSDQGIGISPEHQDKVFERFYRVNSPATRGIPGSGLGLSITKGHVEAHGGRVWMESAAGKGSKFYFSLPVEHAEKARKATDG